MNWDDPAGLTPSMTLTKEPSLHQKSLPPTASPSMMMKGTSSESLPPICHYLNWQTSFRQRCPTPTPTSSCWATRDAFSCIQTPHV